MTRTDGSLTSNNLPQDGWIDREAAEKNNEYANRLRGTEIDGAKAEAGWLKMMQKVTHTEITLDILIFHPVWIPASCRSSDHLCNLFSCRSLFLLCCVVQNSSGGLFASAFWSASTWQQTVLLCKICFNSHKRLAYSLCLEADGVCLKRLKQYFIS